MTLRALALALVTIATQASPSWAAARLLADAGLGGVVRAGRWAPVRVAIENDATELHGELVVSWGTSTTIREVALAVPSRSAFELYIRTPDPRDSMTVTLRTASGDVVSTKVPVTVASPESPIVICVVDSGAPLDLSGCRLAMASGTLPRSPRGYDAADEIVWRAGPSILDPLQRSALDQWRPFHEIEMSGRLAQLPRPIAPAEEGPPRALDAAFAVTAGCAGASLAMATMSQVRRRAPLLASAVVVSLSAVALSASAVVGRIGPASEMIVRHSTVVTQVGPAVSMVAARGTLESPANDPTFAAAALTGALLESPLDRADRFDARGRAWLAGTTGLGATREFTLDAVSTFAPLAMTAATGALRVTNISDRDLRDCRFPDGFRPTRVASLARGETTEVNQVDVTDEAVITCRLDDPPFALLESPRGVRSTGQTVVAVWIPDATRGGLR